MCVDDGQMYDRVYFDDDFHLVDDSDRGLSREDKIQLDKSQQNEKLEFSFHDSD